MVFFRILLGLGRFFVDDRPLGSPRGDYFRLVLLLAPKESEGTTSKEKCDNDESGNRR